MGLRDLTPLFGELGDLKRITSAGRAGSAATRLFAAGWGALVAGQAAGEVALGLTARALAAARLGDLDAESMGALGLSPEAIAAVIERSLNDHLGVVDPGLLRALVSAPVLRSGPAPAFVAALAGQPRAGVTTPGRPRVVLEPPESHAEHCLIVAVYGVLLTPVYGSDPATVMLMSFGHHLHNALMPDSGFTGEMLLGDQLAPAMAHATAAALAELSPGLAGQVEAACAHLAGAATPEARAFHAADAADRVLQIEQYLRASRLTMGQVLGECELVHAGPVKQFQDDVLAEMGLA